MLLHSEGYHYSDVVNARGNEDYVQNGKIHKNVSTQLVLVSGSEDLSLLGSYAPGTIAHTAGFTDMWQKSPSGEWVSM